MESLDLLWMVSLSNHAGVVGEGLGLATKRHPPSLRSSYGGQARRTLGNLFTRYRPLLDTLHFFDNSSNTPRLAFKDESSKTTINDVALYERLRKEFGP